MKNLAVHNLSVLIVELFFLFPYFEAFIAFLSGSEFYVHSETVDYRGIRQVNARGVDEIPNFSLPEIVESCRQVHKALVEPIGESVLGVPSPQYLCKGKWSRQE